MTTTTTHCPIAIIDDHPLLARGLSSELDRRELRARPILVDDDTSPQRVLEQVIETSPRLVLADLHLPIDGGGSGLIEPLSRLYPVAVLTGSTSSTEWARCLHLGAQIVLSKSDPLDDLVDRIELLLKGHHPDPGQRQRLATHLDQARRFDADAAGLATLSPRERVVLEAMMDGLSPADIAQRELVSVQTVRSQVKQVLAKLNVSSQLAAVAVANRVARRSD